MRNQIRIAFFVCSIGATAACVASTDEPVDAKTTESPSTQAFYLQIGPINGESKDDAPMREVLSSTINYQTDGGAVPH
jgi:hypothetical protein